MKEVCYTETERIDGCLDPLLRSAFRGLLSVVCSAHAWSAELKPYDWASRNILVAHANGVVDGFFGTNSREAFLQSYARGHRVFEMDLNLSSDHKLVGVHDWSAATLSGLGFKLPPQTSLPISYKAFKRQKIHGKFSTLGLWDVLHLLRKHQDAVLITDTKATCGSEVTEAFSLIVKTCRRERRLLARIVPQIYNQSMLKTVRSIYNFKSIIYTLYASHDRDQSIIEFVKKSGIRVVTMPPWRAKPEFLKALREIGVFTYVHTINDRKEMDYLLRIGAHGVYSDLLGPDDSRCLN